MIAAEVALILVVAVLVAMFAPTPAVAALICLAAVAVLYGTPQLVSRVRDWWRRRAAASGQRLAQAVAARDTVTGRHRRPDGHIPAGLVSATDNLRKVDADATARHKQMLAAVEAESRPVTQTATLEAAGVHRAADQ